MRPLTHLILGAIFSWIVYLLFPELGLKALIVFASSVLIDIDHYFVAVAITKNLSPFKAHKYFIDTLKDKTLFNKRRLNYELYIFHVLEFYLLLFILSFSYETALLILGGVSFHISLDFFNPIRKEKISILHHFFKKKR